MKKILLVAASVAAIGVAGQASADYNYAGLGLGWTMARAKTTSVDSNNNLFGGTNTRSTKKTAVDHGAFSGKLSIGHHFGQDLGWLVEGGFGMDSTKTEAKYSLTPVAGAAAVTPDNIRISLRRKYTLSLGTGFSKVIAQDFNAYMKVSLLLSKFQVTGASLNNDADLLPASSTKTKMKLGGGLTVGGSKNLTKDLSLGLDYTFEMYQKIKTTAPVLSNVVPAYTTGFNRTMAPCYHTVMLTLARKF